MCACACYRCVCACVRVIGVCSCNCVLYARERKDVCVTGHVREKKDVCVCITGHMIVQYAYL